MLLWGKFFRNRPFCWIRNGILVLNHDKYSPLLVHKIGHMTGKVRASLGGPHYIEEKQCNGVVVSEVVVVLAYQDISFTW